MFGILAPSLPDADDGMQWVIVLPDARTMLNTCDDTATLADVGLREESTVTVMRVAK